MFREKQKIQFQHIHGSIVIKRSIFSLFAKKRFLFSLGIIFAGLSIFAVGIYLNKSESASQMTREIIPQASASELPGWWYRENFGDAVCEKENCKPEQDPDNDGLSNAQEFYYHSHPLKVDTNNNGLSDGEDVAQNYDPSKPGKIKFDEIITDESIEGESLLFDNDVKKIISDLSNTSNTKVVLINDNLVTITNTNNKESILKYMTEVEAVVLKYFPQDIDNYIAQAFVENNPNAEKISDIKLRIATILIEIKKLSVPSDALTLHKYNVASFETAIAVLSVPTKEQLNNVTSVEANTWYEAVRSYTVIGEKIKAETQILKSKYKW